MSPIDTLREEICVYISTQEHNYDQIVPGALPFTDNDQCKIVLHGTTAPLEISSR